jgi:ABC-type sugar transport system permease subunit
MSDTALSPPETIPDASGSQTSFLTSTRARKIKEAALGYIFLLPAFIIIFVFGIFPLFFALYQSTLRGLNKIVGDYDGIGNYVRALGDLAYVLGFWIAIFCFYYTIQTLIKVRRQSVENGDHPWLLALPAGIMAIGFGLFLRFIFLFLRPLLLIAEDIRSALRSGVDATSSELFRQFFAEMIRSPEIQRPLWLSIIVFLLGVVLSVLVIRALPRHNRHTQYLASFFNVVIIFLGGIVLAWFVWQNIQLAYAEAFADGESLSIWEYMVTISAGILLLGLSWLVWRSASGRDTMFGTFLRLSAGIVLIIGAWVLIVEIPMAVIEGDEDWLFGLVNTVFYSAGSIPFQFLISLMLATFLFQNIRFKSGFRLIYFIPYITPAVGAAAVFRILFSGGVNAPINSILSAIGLPTLSWLNEPTGIFQLLVGESVDLPYILAGPSLSLVVIIMFGIWTFVGYNTVIFLAGLGAIPSELYESASIDGAGGGLSSGMLPCPCYRPPFTFSLFTPSSAPSKPSITSTCCAPRPHWAPPTRPVWSSLMP